MIQHWVRPMSQARPRGADDLRPPNLTARTLSLVEHTLPWFCRDQCAVTRGLVAVVKRYDMCEKHVFSRWANNDGSHCTQLTAQWWWRNWLHNSMIMTIMTQWWWLSVSSFAQLETRNNENWPVITKADRRNWCSRLELETRGRGVRCLGRLIDPVFKRESSKGQSRGRSWDQNQDTCVRPRSLSPKEIRLLCSSVVGIRPSACWDWRSADVEKRTKKVLL